MFSARNFIDLCLLGMVQILVLYQTCESFKVFVFQIYEPSTKYRTENIDSEGGSIQMLAKVLLKK